MSGETAITVSATVNGRRQTFTCEARETLADALRRRCQVRGVHLGCEHGVCGACTIRFDGVTARSCLMFAPQADGAEIVTVEGLADGDELHPLQEAFSRHHALQCGFCTPGFLMVAQELLAEGGPLTEEVVREAISGNICRCTGYHNIVEAILAVADARSGEAEK
ncbi:(2Fe-2S)-binding protein [Streptosporangium violaceochromogenes]|nr:(2Fe-2S)-binding protein [Streptosporangium violaceochromogenes]